MSVTESAFLDQAELNKEQKVSGQKESRQAYLQIELL